MSNPVADFPTQPHIPTDTSAFSPTGNKLGTTTPKHTDVEGKQEAELYALGVKLGTGLSSPTINNVLIGDGVGSSSWGKVTTAHLSFTPLIASNNLSDLVNPVTARNNLLPSQTGNNGKYLTTDGTNTSWGTISLITTWGSVTGTLSNQTDLQTALDTKLVKASNLSDLTSAPTARTNLGLGSIALLNSIDISSNTNLAVSSPITLSGDTIGLDIATTSLTSYVLKAGDTMTGKLVVNNTTSSTVAGLPTLVKTGNYLTKGLVVRGSNPVGTGAQPDSISNLKMWMKADAITGKNDGDKISSWSDSSVNGNDLSQATSAKQPVYKTGIINGYPSVRFDGANTYLTNSLALSQPKTVIIVASENNTSTVKYYIDGATVNEMVLYSNSSTTINMYAGGGPGGTVSSVVNFNIITGVFNGASSLISLNGSTTNGTTSGSSTGITLGAGAGGFSYMDGDILEVIIYDKALSTAERQSIENYLALKYDLPLTATTQTANLFEIQNNSTNLLSSFDYRGALALNTTSYVEPVASHQAMFIAKDGLMKLYFTEHASGQGYIGISNGTIIGYIGHTNATDGFTTGASSSSKLTLRAFGNSNVMQFQNNGKAIIACTLAESSPLSGAQLEVDSFDATTITQILKGASFQSANLTEWQDSSAAILSKIDASGNATLNNAFVGDIGFGANYAAFAHKSSGVYAFLADNSGNSFFNAASGQTISFRINNSTKMFIDALGHFGFGNSGPQSLADFSGGVAIGTYAGVTAAPTNGLIISGKVGIANGSPTYQLDVTGDINSTGVYRSGGTAGVSGSFTTVDSKTVTVTNGIITAIV